IEFVQLMRAVDPSDPVLIAPIDPVATTYAAPMIHALEWCAAQGASVVATFPARPRYIAPYDRVLYGAMEVVREIETARTRFIAARGRAHHASAIEQRLEAALRHDSELALLFLCNETVSVPGCGSARCVLYCRA